ncbi:MAG: ABC transporter permease [Bacteroidales bacterium]
MKKIRRGSAWQLLECELYKLIHHRWIIILWLSPACLVISAFVYMMANYPEFTQGGIIEYPYNPFSKVSYALFKLYQFTFSFLIALLAAQYFLMEKQGDGGKLFNTFPYPQYAGLAIRFMVLLALLFTSILLAYTVFLGGIGICNLFCPLLSFGGYDMRLASLVFFSRLLFAACCIGLIQYGLHLLTQSWYLPLIAAFLAITLGVMPEQYERVDYYFAVGYLNSIANEFSSGGMEYQWQYAIAMLAAPVLITLGCFIIKRKY